MPLPFRRPSTPEERRLRNQEAKKKRIAALKARQGEILPLLGEAGEAQKAHDARKKLRSSMFWKGQDTSGFEVMPAITEAERANAKKTKQILEIMEQKKTILENLAVLQGENNSVKKMEMTIDLLNNLWDANAKVQSAALGAKGTVLGKQIDQVAQLGKEESELAQRFSLQGADPATLQALEAWKTTTNGIWAPEIGEAGEAGLVDATVEALGGVTDPEQKAKMLSEMQAIALKNGHSGVTPLINQARTMHSEEGARSLMLPRLVELVQATAGIEDATLAAAERRVTVKAQKLAMMQRVAEETTRLGGKAGKLDELTAAYQQVDALTGTQEKEALAPHLQSLKQLDALIKDLERPSYTDAWQRARGQLLAHPTFDNYMDMRGFAAGQEDEAIIQLMKESKPVIQRQLAAARLSGTLTAEESPGSKIPFIGSLIGPSEGQKEARRIALEREGKEPDQASIGAQTLEAREKAGLTGETLFQQKGISPQKGAIPDAPVPKEKGAKVKTGDDDGEAHAILPPTQEVAPSGQLQPQQPSAGQASMVGGAQPAIDMELSPSQIGLKSEGHQKRIQAIQDLA